MQLEHIQYEAVRGWARITLNRPERHNAMSNALLDELHAALWEADEDREIAAVLIRGAGPSFCSGYDLGRDLKHQRPRLRPEASRFRGGSQIDDDIWQMERNARVLLSIFDMHKPVVAQVHGNCLAGGMDLMMQCDMAIAAEDAIIGFPPVRKMGTPPMNMWPASMPEGVWQ